MAGSEVVQLSGRSGVWLAVGASVSLVVFFYGSAALALVGALSVCITGFFALAWALDPLLSLITASSSSSSSAFSASSSASMSSPFVMRSYELLPTLHDTTDTSNAKCGGAGWRMAGW